MQADEHEPRTGTPPDERPWSIDSGSLPPGVTLSPTGLLAGTPTAEGSYQFVVKAQLDRESRFDTETLCRGRAVRRRDLAPKVPSSEVGVPFQLQMTASGGTGAGYTWAPRAHRRRASHLTQTAPSRGTPSDGR